MGLLDVVLVRVVLYIQENVTFQLPALITETSEGKDTMVPIYIIYSKTSPRPIQTKLFFFNTICMEIVKSSFQWKNKPVILAVANPVRHISNAQFVSSLKQLSQ